MNSNDTFQDTLRNIFTYLKDRPDWQEFVETIERKNRYFQSDNVTKCLESLLPFNTSLAVDSKLFRARVLKTELIEELKKSKNNSKTERIIGLHKDQMGSPTDGNISNGRADPHGISYLYLASDPETACSEVKPDIYSTISVAKFKLLQDRSCIDFRKCPVEKQSYNCFFYKLQRLFSIPHKESDGIEYIITQYVSAFFQHKQKDGIIYSSSCNPSRSSYNLVLFNPQSAECIDEYGNFYACTKKTLAFQNLSDAPYDDYQVSAGTGKLSDVQISEFRKIFFGR